jgi:hypothetical protein
MDDDGVVLSGSAAIVLYRLFAEGRGDAGELAGEADELFRSHEIGGTMIRIYADFNNTNTEAERVRLNTMGSREDIEKHKDLITEGLRVILYTPKELDVEAVLCFDGGWCAVPDYDTLVYTDDVEEPSV